jgi:hypothetical protein
LIGSDFLGMFFIASEAFLLEVVPHVVPKLFERGVCMM